MISKLLEILFPSPCLSCGYLGKALCDRCFNKLSFCPHIRVIDGMKVCCSTYFQPNSILERLIHPFKYKHHAEIFRCFVPHMREAIKLLSCTERIIFVPVPLHKKRLLERGYNQSELLSKWVAKNLGCETMNLLERIKNTSSQAGIKSSNERKENIHGAFKMQNGCPFDSQIVLVDDIVTTGSTLLECRNVLRAAGVENITALCLADREKTPQNPWN